MGLLLLLASCALVCPASLEAAAAPITVGYTTNFPHTYQDGAGAPAGFVIDVISEAARREGIELSWKFNPERGLESDLVDLWPAGVSTEARRRRFHFTPPWWNDGLVILAQGKNVRSLDQVADKRFVLTGDLEGEVQRVLPRSTRHRATTHKQAFLEVCKGDADAMVTNRTTADRLLLHRPAECGNPPLSLLALHGAAMSLHILALPRAAETAERLRHRIEEMREDGTLAMLALRYPAISSGSAAFIAGLAEAHYQNRNLRMGVALVTSALAACGMLLFWALRQIRARKVAQARLLEANSVLREANADLEHFNYAVSHDLAEPLRNISLYTELLQRRQAETLSPDGQKWLGVVHDSVFRMHHLLEDLRRYALVSRDLSSAEPADSRAALEYALANLRTLREETGAVITNDTELPLVCVQVTVLAQLFQNLLSNAIKYRGKEPPVIHISAARRGRDWTFSVRDNGIGIAPEYRDKVFSLFRRLHGQEIRGAGIGLALCRKIVERAGGTIWVEPNADAGSTFRFTLPGAD